MTEEWLERIDESHVRIKESCPLTLLQLVDFISNDDRKFLVGGDWCIYNPSSNQSSPSTAIIAVDYTGGHKYFVGHGFSQDCITFLLSLPNPDVFRLSLYNVKEENPIVNLSDVVDPIQLQRILQDPQNSVKDIRLGGFELDGSISSALCCSRSLVLTDCHIREVLSNLSHRSHLAPIKLHIEAVRSENIQSLNRFFVQDISLPNVTVRIFAYKLNGLLCKQLFSFLRFPMSGTRLVALQRLEVCFKYSFAQSSEAVLKYARKTSTPIGLDLTMSSDERDEAKFRDLCDVVDTWIVYFDDPWLDELIQSPKTRKLVMNCKDRDSIPFRVWKKVLSCRHLDSVSLQYVSDSSILPIEYIFELIHENDRLVEFQVSTSHEPQHWTMPRDVRQTLNCNRHRRMKQFMMECNMLPSAYNHLRMGASLLYLQIKANAGAFRD